MPWTDPLRVVLRRFIPSAVLEKRAGLKAFRLAEIENRLRRCLHAEQTTVTISGDWAACPEATVVFESLTRVLRGETRLPPAIFDIDGMSGRRYRSLINDAMATLPDARYLEIGSWAGSTACSAMYGNPLTITCIDNWSEFGGPKQQFLDNVAMARSDAANFTLIESDFRQIDYRQIGRFNTFLFDGPHSERDHYDGITLVQPALDDVFILIVDDWNWPSVRFGTLRGLADQKIDQLLAVEIRSTQDNTHPTRAIRKHSDWHNGYCLCVCRKAG
jgi:Methyltransferase domain